MYYIQGVEGSNPGKSVPVYHAAVMKNTTRYHCKIYEIQYTAAVSVYRSFYILSSSRWEIEAKCKIERARS